MTTSEVGVDRVSAVAEAILDEVEKAVLGKRSSLRLILMALHRLLGVRDRHLFERLFGDPAVDVFGV